MPDSVKKDLGLYVSVTLCNDRVANITRQKQRIVSVVTKKKNTSVSPPINGTKKQTGYKLNNL